MELETLLLTAIQSSFILGILHGINPCGHSWLVLAPFTAGEKKGKRVLILTTAFVAGTALACIVLGLSLGAVAQFIPEAMTEWVEIGTSVILIVLGALLIYNPHILHNHDHEHEHQHQHQHDHDTCHHHQHKKSKQSLLQKLKTMTNTPKMLPTALFGIGFVNMIIPCPTAAVMYGYALNAQSVLNATIVFGVYALATAISVGGVIFLIFKVTTMAHSLQKEWVEPTIMRLAGLIIVLFSGYQIIAGH